MNIGLTGGIACGKSTVAAMLVDRGAILIDADAISREVVLPGSPALSRIVSRFGLDMLQSDGTLNRKKLGETVFADETSRKDLEDILHPAIRSTMWERMKEGETRHPDKLVVVDVPLLYESGLQDNFQEVLVVYVPRDIQLHRLMERDHLSREQAESRLAAQMPIEEKKKLADILIRNDGVREETERQIEQFWLGKGLQ